MTGNPIETTNFIWGNFGDELQKLDPERYLAIGLYQSDLFLSRIYNKRIIEAVKYLKDGNIKKYLEVIDFENNADTLFREVSALLRLGMDMVSIGSALTGNVKPSMPAGRIVRKPKNNEINENGEEKNE